VHVVSGKCTLVLDFAGRGLLYDCYVASNSRYLVIWENFFDNECVHADKMLGAKLNLFDLQSLRNTSSPYAAPLSEHVVIILVLLSFNGLNKNYFGFIGALCS
jgi:hypothetical protein